MTLDTQAIREEHEALLSEWSADAEAALTIGQCLALLESHEELQQRVEELERKNATLSTTLLDSNRLANLADLAVARERVEELERAVDERDARLEARCEVSSVYRVSTWP